MKKRKEIRTWKPRIESSIRDVAKSSFSDSSFGVIPVPGVCILLKIVDLERLLICFPITISA